MHVHVPDNFDFLSIDIDGNDLWVWKSLQYKPRVILLSGGLGPRAAALSARRAARQETASYHNTEGPPEGGSDKRTKR